MRAPINVPNPPGPFVLSLSFSLSVLPPKKKKTPRTSNSKAPKPDAAHEHHGTTGPGPKLRGRNRPGPKLRGRNRSWGRSRSFENVPEPVRHRRDDVEPRGAALPGGVRHGGRQAGLRLRRPLVPHPRRPCLRQQGCLRALLPPAQGLPRVADHAGVALAGLTADGRVLSRFLRNECINHSSVYEAPLPVSRLALRLADKAQVCTQRSWKRPYGVGLLVAGLDETGAHLYYNCPSGNYVEYQTTRHLLLVLDSRGKGYEDYTPEQLVKDALSAIKETLQGESALLPSLAERMMAQLSHSS
ncbi:hypothetical protein GQ55_3G198300 [Panicum hallii var. hallii]|uniref:Proteasome endopeptidase complex n=1 Tax=Panicum hallii var. hallii TaxID=1504633 RepID=A0A2T7EBD0_9POAL|nr:hypothetical protein GQ55_3G198300 [Panicum hallii var. hallii]